MSPLAITVLVACIALMASTGVLAIASAGLWYAVKNQLPAGQLRSKVSELSAMVDNLEAQVINLRTRKAAKASPRTQPKADTEDVAGVDEEEQALFRQLGFPS